MLGPLKKRRLPEIVTDPVLSAKEAGLRYVSDAQPGIRRRKSGKGFRYLDAEAKPVRNKDILQRIRSLVIPPAWTDVWICADGRGHLQATGLDARGRKQSRYHPRWRMVRDETKYERMLLFGTALRGIRARLEEDLALPGLPRNKVLATIVRLMERTLIRVGNEEYARENKSYGLTTMRAKHVQVNGSTVVFHFRGKSGKLHAVGVEDRRLVRIVRQCQDLPGYELFEYQDELGETRKLGSADVNDYLRAAAERILQRRISVHGQERCWRPWRCVSLKNPRRRLRRGKMWSRRSKPSRNSWEIRQRCAVDVTCTLHCWNAILRASWSGGFGERLKRLSMRCCTR